MSWVATAGGVLLGPVVGALATRFISDVVKPKEMTSTVFIGAAVHAASAVVAHTISEHVREENVHAFAYGATWGEGITAGLLLAGGLYYKTEAGKKALAEGSGPVGPLRLMTSGTDSYALAPYGGASSRVAPRGLLGLLTAARAHGYA